MSNVQTLTPPRVMHPSSGTTEQAPPRRGWAWAGLGAGVCGLAIFAMAGLVDAPDAAWADNEVLVSHVLDSKYAVWAFQSVTVLAAGLLVVFGAGLRRQLSGQAPVHSLLPDVAFAGAALTAALLLVGGGIGTDLFWALLQDPGKVDPDYIAAEMAIFNTLGWVWAGLGLSSGAVAVAALRHGAAQRWIGWVSVGMTALVAVTQLVPLQYMALVPAALWLAITAPFVARRERTG